MLVESADEGFGGGAAAGSLMADAVVDGGLALVDASDTGCCSISMSLCSTTGDGTSSGDMISLPTW